MRAIVTDAAFCRKSGVAGLAFCWEDGGILGTEIASAQNSNHAEAMALIRATSFIAAGHAERGQLLLTDSLVTVHCLEGRNSGEQFFMQAISQLRKFQAIRGFEVEHVPRYRVKPANAAAWHVLRAWKIGAGLSERWKRPGYIFPPEILTQTAAGERSDSSQPS